MRVEAVSQRRNLLTDELVTTASGSTIESVAGFHPRFVRVSELGDQLFLIATDGVARRLVIRDVERPEPMETFRAIPADAGPAQVTAVERLFGGLALAVGDDAGAVRVFFTSRGGDALAALLASDDPLRAIADGEFAQLLARGLETLPSPFREGPA